MGKALLIGGTGFIGSHIAKELLKQREIKLLVRDPAAAEELFGSKAEYCRGDIMDVGSVAKALKGCDTLYYSAGLVSFRRNACKEIYKINVEGTRNVCKAALESGIEKMIFTSSAATIGKEKNGFSTEETAFNLWKISSPYKKSKVHAENVVLEHHAKGLPAVILNPSIPVGAEDKRISPSGSLIIGYFNRRVTGFIRGGMNFVDVEDIAKAHLLAEKYGKTGERYIIGSENLKLDEFYKILRKVSGERRRLVRVPYPVALAAGGIAQKISAEKEPPVSAYTVRLFYTKLFYDIGKAKKELGFEPEGIEEACRKSIEWYKKSGHIIR